jgi:hypothetical protein
MRRFLGFANGDGIPDFRQARKRSRYLARRRRGYRLSRGRSDLRIDQMVKWTFQRKFSSVYCRTVAGLIE